MFNTIRQFLRARNELKRFGSQPQSDREIVFYSEDSHSMMHFEAIIDKLTTTHNRVISYLTSDPIDSVFQSTNPNIKAFYIGEGTVRTLAFMKLKANLCIMTMPDIENFHIKRSKLHPVHYIYLFHALVSTHSNYRKGAFDHYDTIFCTGSFQIDEIRKTERVYNLKPKTLYKDGYRRLEVLINEVKTYRAERPSKLESPTKTVILAPSWGDNSILEVCGDELINVLLNAGYTTIVRPHPMTTKNKPKLIEGLMRSFGNRDNFTLQTDIKTKESLYDSHVMISDWSGIALEYAFSCERPVLYIDVPQKRNNQEADLIDIEPIESSIREKIGRIISPDKLEELPSAIEDIYQNSEKFIEQIRTTRAESVFNLGNSLEGAVNNILDIANSRKHL